MKRWYYILFVVIMTFGLAGCIQPIAAPPQPEAETAALPQTATYTDENGLFTAEYPADWVVDPYGMGDGDPTPHVNFGSNQEILELSMIGEPLPEGQIGMTLILLPRAMEPKITAETPLEEVVVLLLTSMDPPEEQDAIPDFTFKSITLENGRPAVRFTMAVPTEAYVVHLADMGDGVYLLAPQILAVDYENAALQAQVEAIINSVKVTASGDEIMAVMMERMGNMPSDDGSTTGTTMRHELLITATSEGWQTESTLAAGWTTVTIVNESEDFRQGQLFRLNTDKSAEDAAAALAANSQPEWLIPVGGIAIVPPGNTQRVMLNLAPGNYILADPLPGFDGVLGIDKGYFTPITVEVSESVAVEPVADMTLGLADYAFLFDYSAVTAGKHTIAVHNQGPNEIHEALFVRLDEGVSLQDFLSDFGPNGPQGPPRGMPVGGIAAFATDSSAYFEIEFEAGATYGLICFMPSTEHAAQSHFMLGMLGEFTVPGN